MKLVVAVTVLLLEVDSVAGRDVVVVLRTRLSSLVMLRDVDNVGEGLCATVE